MDGGYKNREEGLLEYKRNDLKVSFGRPKVYTPLDENL